VSSVWLGIDTASDVASVAVHDGGAVVAECSWFGRQRHTVELAPRVEWALATAGVAAASLGGVAVALGPGSYTGLRIGLALAKGLAFGAGLPLVGVPTLDVLAASLSPPVVPRAVPLWAVLRAGRAHLVAAPYPAEETGWPDARSLRAATLAELLAVARPPAWVAGELTEAEAAALAAAGLTVLPPAARLRRAGWLAELGRRRHDARGGDDPVALAPIYLGGDP
jgi:tRNA threonylcarbamoyladenosine biosynthesis protein TsaB